MPAMRYWSPLVVNGVEVSLSHLEPFVFRCAARDVLEPVELNVRFNDHCFSKTFDPAFHTHDDVIRPSHAAKTERRVFCPDRYALSLHLRRIIEALGDKHVASTREGNLVRMELEDGQIYAIFFTLRRKMGRRIDLFVVSAYPVAMGKKPADTGEMRFDLALAKVLRGEKPKFPNRR